MASHTSTGANLTSNTNGNLQTSQEFVTALVDDVINSSEQLRTSQEFEMAFQDLHKGVRNNEKLLAFVDNYYVNTPDLCAALQQRLNTTNNHEEASLSDPLMIFHSFFHDLSYLYRQQLMMRVALRSLDDSFNEKLDRINALKKVSAVLFTAAAAISSGVAAANANPRKSALAAAASILFEALGKWIHSLLKKRESAVKKHKETISVMIMAAKITIKHLTDINAVARRLHFQTESMSETVDDEVAVRLKLAALDKSFQELRGKANVHSQDMNWIKQIVLQTLVVTYGN